MWHHVGSKLPGISGVSSFHPRVCPGFYPQEDGPGRGLLSAALLGDRLDEGFLGTSADDNPTGDGHGEYCLQKYTRHPPTTRSREAAAPQEERLGEGIAIGGHSGHGRAGGPTHSLYPVLPSLNCDGTAGIHIPLPRRHNFEPGLGSF